MSPGEAWQGAKAVVPHTLRKSVQKGLSCKFTCPCCKTLCGLRPVRQVAIAGSCMPRAKSIKSGQTWCGSGYGNGNDNGNGTGSSASFIWLAFPGQNWQLVSAPCSLRQIPWWQQQQPQRIEIGSKCARAKVVALLHLCERRWCRNRNRSGPITLDPVSNA